MSTKDEPLNASTALKDTLSGLKAQLKDVGVKWSAVRPLLPDWTEEAVQYRSGVIELEGFIARHFGLRLSEGGGFERLLLPAARFKSRGGADESSVRPARQFATAVAGMVARAMPARTGNGGPHGLSADALRIHALSRSNERGWIDLPALVETAWSIGIPVIYLPDVPGKDRKPEGMVTLVGGTPVVVLMKKHVSPDWLLFVLAHELGHIELEHLGTVEGAAVVDMKVDGDESQSNEAHDSDEVAANLYAAQVLIQDGTPFTLKRWAKAEVLADEALRLGREHRVSPGYIVLNAIWNIRSPDAKPWALATKALGILNQRQQSPTTSEVCLDAIRRHLDMDALKFDTIEFLEKLKVI